jgi:hypothetical protein
MSPESTSASSASSRFGRTRLATLRRRSLADSHSPGCGAGVASWERLRTMVTWSVGRWRGTGSPEIGRPVDGG